MNPVVLFSGLGVIIILTLALAAEAPGVHLKPQAAVEFLQPNGRAIAVDVSDNSSAPRSEVIDQLPVQRYTLRPSMLALGSKFDVRITYTLQSSNFFGVKLSRITSAWPSDWRSLYVGTNAVSGPLNWRTRSVIIHRNEPVRLVYQFQATCSPPGFEWNTLGLNVRATTLDVFSRSLVLPAEPLYVTCH
jgi:hypothetical protein